MGFEGEEDLGGRDWEAVEMVLWVRVVDTVREVVWGVMEDDVMIFVGEDNAGEGSLGVGEVMYDSEALGGVKGNLEFKEFRGAEDAAKEGSTDTDSEHWEDGG